MNILHEIEDRRARRGLSEEPVDERIAAELAYSATLAPSCFNNQPWRLIVVRNEPGNAQAPKESVLRSLQAMHGRKGPHGFSCCVPQRISIAEWMKGAIMPILLPGPAGLYLLQRT